MTTRILLVEGSEDGTTGGSHRSLADLARLLRPRGYDTRVVFYEDNAIAVELRQFGIPVQIWARDRERVASHARFAKFSARLAVLPRIRRRWQYLRSQQISLVHLNNAPTLGFEDWLPAARLARIPCITHMRGDVAPYMPGTRIGRLLVRSFDRVIAISRHIVTAAERIGVPPQRVTLVYNGIDVDAWRASVTRPQVVVRSELGIAPDAHVVTMVGNIRDWKGQHLLLDAIARLPEASRTGLRVLFVGDVGQADQSYYERLRRRVEAARLGSVVAFLGARSNVAEIMNASDVIVHASVRPEPFGRVLLEAMALGKPLLAPRLGGPAEMLTSDCGVLYEPDSSEDLARQLGRIRDDATWGAGLGKRAIERARVFDVARTVDGVVRVYEELLGAAE